MAPKRKAPKTRAKPARAARPQARAGPDLLTALPAELLLEIIKHTVPSIRCTRDEYYDRMDQLLLLSSTCRVLHAMTAPVLYADVRLDGNWQLELLERTLVTNRGLAEQVPNWVRYLDLIRLDLKRGPTSRAVCGIVLDFLLGGVLREVCFTKCTMDETLLTKLDEITRLKMNETYVTSNDIGVGKLRFPALESLVVVQAPSIAGEDAEWFINSTCLPALTHFSYENFGAKRELDRCTAEQFRTLLPSLTHLRLEDTCALYGARDDANLWRSLTQLATLELAPVPPNEEDSEDESGALDSAEDEDEDDNERVLRCALKNLDHSLEKLVVPVFVGDVAVATCILKQAFEQKWKSVQELKTVEYDPRGEWDEYEQEFVDQCVDSVIEHAARYGVVINGGKRKTERFLEHYAPHCECCGEESYACATREEVEDSDEESVGESVDRRSMTSVSSDSSAHSDSSEECGSGTSVDSD